MKVYTRTGDDGTTALFHGGRVPKDDLRTEAYGTTDEAVSALGIARAAAEPGEWHDAILAVQRDLFVVGAQLATRADAWVRLSDGVSRTTETMVQRLEDSIDELIERQPLPREFAVPGGSPAGAALDLARTIVRRAERCVAHLRRNGELPDPLPLIYLNRLSDYLFVLARTIEGSAYTPTRPR